MAITKLSMVNANVSATKVTPHTHAISRLKVVRECADVPYLYQVIGGQVTAFSSVIQVKETRVNNICTCMSQVTVAHVAQNRLISARRIRMETSAGTHVMHML